MTTDAEPAAPSPLADLEKQLGKEATDALVAWFGEGHTDKAVAFLRRFVCGIGTVVSDPPLREGAAVLGRAIDALEAWTLSDQQKHIELLAAQAKAMTGKDLSESLVKELIGWTEKRSSARGTTTAEWFEKGVEVAMQAAGMPGIPKTARRAPPPALGSMGSVDIEEVTFLASVNGEEIEHVYNDDADLAELFKTMAPIGTVFGAWITNPEQAPLVAYRQAPQLVRVPEALGFFVMMDIRDGRGILGYRLVFTRKSAIEAILKGQHPLAAVLETVISNLSYDMYPDTFEIMTSSDLADDAADAAAAEPTPEVKL